MDKYLEISNYFSVAKSPKAGSPEEVAGVKPGSGRPGKPQEGDGLCFLILLGLLFGQF